MSENKIWDLSIEVKCLKTVLSDTPYSAKLYGFLKPEHFHFKLSKVLFARLQEVMVDLDSFPSWRMLVTDSKFETGVQSALQDEFETSAIAESSGDLDYLVKNLNDLANKRAIYATVYETQESLYDPDKSARDIANEVSVAITKIDHDEILSELNMGVEYNDLAEQILQETLYGDNTKNRVPSGFKSFDTESLGFQRGNLVCLGATSGGGKCTDYKTLIPTTAGILPIGDIHRLFGGGEGWSIPQANFAVVTREGLKPVEGIYKGYDSTLQIETNWGDKFRGTEEHKILCLLNDELNFKRLVDIKVGDWIPKEFNAQVFGERLLDDSTITLSKEAIPEVILRADKMSQVAFMRSLFEANGDVYLKYELTGGYWCLELYSLSEQLIYQAKSILENMGILSSVRLASCTRRWVSLSVNRSSFKEFYNTIGFISEFKLEDLGEAIDHLDTILTSRGKENKIPTEAILAYLDRLRDICKDAPLWKVPKNIYKHQAYKIINDPKVKEVVEQDPLLNVLRCRIEDQLKYTWAQVTKITEFKEKTAVFDLSVKDKREYSASGVMSHNSQMALNLMTRQYLMGFDVVMASYEMGYDEIMQREFALISEVPHKSIKSQNLTAEQKRVVECSFREFNLAGKKNGNGFWLACPNAQTTVTEIGLRYMTRKPTCIIFDYINLLKSSNKQSDAQWQVLGDIAKEAKVLARRLNCVVYLLIQIDKEHNLRYSQAIKDHADWIWGWVYDEDAKMNGFVNIKQIKARSAACYDFQLVTRFDIAQFRDPDQEDKLLKYSDEQYHSILAESRQYGSLIDLFKEAIIIPQAAPSPMLLGRKTPARSYL
jgi:replicative DNA helicase